MLGADGAGQSETCREVRVAGRGQRAGFRAAGRGRGERVGVAGEASLAPRATKGISSCG